MPTTISPEAQTALAKYDRQVRDTPLPAPDDIEGWKRVQAGVVEKYRIAAEEVVRKYEPQIAERKIADVPVLDVKPHGWRDDGRVLVYTHGGAYTMHSARSRLLSAVPMAHDTQLRVIAIDYTLAPHSKWPATTDQVVAVVQALLAEGRTPQQVAIYGESAGGGLAAGAVLKMRDQGLKLPAAVVLWSPWSDISDTGDTYETLQAADPLLYYPRSLRHCADAYADPKDQQHPYVSPVYGDYKPGFPPTLIQAGTKEIFLSNAVRQYQVLDNASIPVKLDLYEGMWHIFQVLTYDIPEAHQARKKVRVFLDEHLKASPKVGE